MDYRGESTEKSVSPVQLPDIANLKSIVENAGNPVILKNDGTVWLFHYHFLFSLLPNDVATIQVIGPSAMGFLDLGAATIIKGDVNFNGEIDLGDILLVRDFIFGEETTSAEFEAADINSDGRIDVGDILDIRDVIFGIFAE